MNQEEIQKTSEKEGPNFQDPDRKERSRWKNLEETGGRMKIPGLEQGDRARRWSQKQKIWVQLEETSGTSSRLIYQNLLILLISAETFLKHLETFVDTS